MTIRVPLEVVVTHLRQRLSDVEYENAILRGQLEIYQNGIMPAEESGAGRPVSSGKENEHPAPEG